MDEIQVVFLTSPREVHEVIDDPEFSHVMQNGEVYEKFEVISIACEYINHPQLWTHGVTVRHHLSQECFSADLRVINFGVDESAVYGFC